MYVVLTPDGGRNLTGDENRGNGPQLLGGFNQNLLLYPNWSVHMLGSTKANLNNPTTENEQAPSTNHVDDRRGAAAEIDDRLEFNHEQGGKGRGMMRYLTWVVLKGAASKGRL